MSACDPKRAQRRILQSQRRQPEPDPKFFNDFSRARARAGHFATSDRDRIGGRTRTRTLDRLKIKKRLDGLMLEELSSLAEERGDDPEKIKVDRWTNHDLRRTLRSGLSALRVNSDVAEAVLAHVKPGIRGVYDRYDLFDEKRQALDLWAGRLRSVVEPAPGNLVKLVAGR